MNSYMNDPGNASHDAVDPYDFVILEQDEEHHAYIPIGRGNREDKQNAFVTESDEKEEEEDEYSFHTSNFSEKDGGAMVGLDFDLEGNNNGSPEVDKKLSKPVSGLHRGTGLPKKHGEAENIEDCASLHHASVLESPERQQVSSTIYHDSDGNTENVVAFKDKSDQPVLKHTQRDYDELVKKTQYESPDMLTSSMQVTERDNHLLTTKEEVDKNV